MNKDKLVNCPECGKDRFYMFVTTLEKQKIPAFKVVCECDTIILTMLTPIFSGIVNE